MIEAAAANCELAGIRDQIRAWLADNGYASAANFAALEHLMLLVAVTGEASQTGRAGGGRALRPAWEKMAARLATPAGQKLYKRRAASSSPPSPSCSPGSAATSTTAAATPSTPRSSSGAVHNLAKLLTTSAWQPASPPDQAQPQTG